MKLLHFTYDHPRNPWAGGGGSLRAEKFGRFLAQKGVDVHLVSGRFPGAIETQEPTFRWTFLGKEKGYVKSTFSYASEARRYARVEAHSYDLVIEDFAPWNPLFTYRLKAPPAVVQVQNFLGTGILKKYLFLGLPFFLLERFYPRRFAHAIAVNAPLNRRFKIQGEVISNGFAKSLLTTEASTGDYVAFMGRLDIYQKGLDLLVEATKGLDIPIQVAGDGPDRARFAKCIAACPNFQTVGHLAGEAKIDFLRKSRFVVVPSRYEGQNIVVLEGAALGKAVLVSDIQELHYAVEGGFAVAFKSNSRSDLRRCILELWTQENLRHQLEHCARPGVNDLTWENQAERFEKYCRQVVAACKGKN